MKSRIGALLASVVILMLSTRCRTPECSESLVTQFGRATFAPETWLIDFGLPEYRQYLLTGWSADERWADRRFSFVWATGPASAIRMNRYRISDVRLRFRCAPNSIPGQERQAVSIVVNGVSVTSVQLDEGFSNHEVALPATRFRIGENIVEFRYRTWGRPAPRSVDTRDLAVAWDWIEVLESHGRPSLRSARRGEDWIAIPYRSALRFPFDEDSGAGLEVDELSVEGETGEDPGRLQIALRSREGRLLGSFTAIPGTRHVRFRFSQSSRVNGVLEISALEPQRGAPSATAIILRNPRVVRHCK